MDGQAGASVVEYALLIALIALVCFLAVQFLGGSARDGLSRAGSSGLGLVVSLVSV